MFEKIEIIALSKARERERVREIPKWIETYWGKKKIEIKSKDHKSKEKEWKFAKKIDPNS